MDIDGLIHRIVSGHYYILVDNIKHKIKSPNLELRSRAHFIYNTIIDDNKFDTDSWITDQQIDTLLLFNGIWNINKQKELEDQLKLLDQNKVDLFLNYSNDKQRKKIKHNIESITSYIHQLYDKKNTFRFLSLDFYAKTIENQFLVLNMVYTNNDDLLFDQDTDNIDMGLFTKLIEEIQKYSIDIGLMKNIAKSDQWKNYWNAGREQIIDGPSYNWTEEQVTLINLSKTYDSIREHLECPSEDIIKDDDALDGWMIHQNKKIETEKKKQKLEAKHNLSAKKADEVFILTDSVEETKEIFDLNDYAAKDKIKQLKEISKTNKETKWVDVPFVQKELQLQRSSKMNNKG